MNDKIVDNGDDVAEALRRLPTLTPPEAVSQVLRQLASTPSGAPAERSRVGQWMFGAAASAALLALLLAMPRDGLTPTDAPQPVASLPAGEPTQVQALMARSDYLESLLAAVPDEGRVQRVGTASTISALEDRVAMIDARLGQRLAQSNDPDASLLLRERVGLMSTLVQLKVGSGESLWL